MMAEAGNMSEFHKIKSSFFADHSTRGQIKMLLVCERDSIDGRTVSSQKLEFVFDDYSQAEQTLEGLLLGLRESFPEHQ